MPILQGGGAGYGESIKGITVEIGGDTTKLQSALKGVNPVWFSRLPAQ